MDPEKVLGHGKASEDLSMLGVSWGGEKRRGWIAVNSRAFPSMCDKCTSKTYCHQVTLYLSLSSGVALGLANGEGGRLECREPFLERGGWHCVEERVFWQSGPESGSWSFCLQPT